MNPVDILRASRIRIGKKTRIQGVPAILLGVSCVVVAAGIARAFNRAMPVLPDAFREGRNLWDSLRRDRRPLNP
jgi:hypothetical protein